jgi:hypothetical protein
MLIGVMDKKETPIDRLKLFIEDRGLTVRSFERKCKLGNAYIAKTKAHIGLENLHNILEAYPELNEVWLLTGQGNMKNTFDGSNKSSSTVNIASNNNNSDTNIGADNQNMLSMMTALQSQITEANSNAAYFRKRVEELEEENKRLKSIIESLKKD